MGAPKGNKFWKMRSKHGRSKIFEDAEAMLEAAYEYFDYVTDNPLQEAVVFQGEVTGKKPLMRAMTIEGLCLFWGTHSEYLTQFENALNKQDENGKDFSRVIKIIRNVIKEQKFTGAAAGLLNPNIIARDLGLTDKQVIEQSNTNYNIPDNTDPVEAARMYQEALKNE